MIPLRSLQIVVPMASWLRRTVFAMMVLLIAVFLAGEAMRVGVAGFLGDSSDVGELQQAVQLDSTNASLHHSLGAIYSYDHSDAADAIPHLRRAVKLSPYDAYYWLDLGWACFGAGDEDCAREGFSHAVRFAPTTPRFQWQTAIYFVMTGHKAEALSHLGRYLELVADDPAPVFALYGRAFNHSDELWQELAQLRDGNRLKLAYVDFLLQSGHGDIAAHYWQQLLSMHAPMRTSTAITYVQHLLDAGQYGEAAQVWHDLQPSAVTAPGRPGDLVFNGSFEQQPLNSGFDWQFQPMPYVSLDFSARAARDGVRCLQIDYTVPDNSESEPVFHFLPVAGNTTYALSAFVRSQDIHSDSGPRLRVIDPTCLSCPDTSTDGTTGTTPWHEVTTTFTTAPATKVVRMSVWRPRSRSFPTSISGEFWIDSVSLRPIGEQLVQPVSGR